MDWSVLIGLVALSCLLNLLLCRFDKQLIKFIVLFCQVAILVTVALLGATMDQTFVYLIVSVTVYLWFKIFLIQREGGKK